MKKTLAFQILLPIAVVGLIAGCTKPSAPTSTGMSDTPNLPVSENPGAVVSPSPMVPIPNASNVPSAASEQTPADKMKDQRTVDQMRAKQVASPTR
jgi:hypothetical protein